jgi:hypothetical protein
MGIFSRIRSRRSGGVSLVRVQEDSPKLEQLKEEAAAEDARLEQDDNYFDPDSPGHHPF